MSVLTKRADSTKRPLQRLPDETNVNSTSRGSFSSISSFKVKQLAPEEKTEKAAEKKEEVVQDAKVEEGEKERRKSVRQLEVACVSQEGLYHENEDRMAYGLALNSEIDGFVGVFDGHGGEDCADYISNALSKYLLQYFKKPEDWKNGEKTMKKMFHNIEEEFVKLAMEEDDTSGSCATVVLVRNHDALVANIGDCKAVAVPNIKDPMNCFQVLTGDHRADAPDESARINKAGASVVDGRVCNLQPSRSFGDIDVKEIVGEGVVIPTPEVSRVKMEPGGFMIVATDGLWDSVDTETAVKVCKDSLLASDFDAETAAEELVELAFENKSTDDITVSIILWKASTVSSEEAKTDVDVV